MPSLAHLAALLAVAITLISTALVPAAAANTVTTLSYDAPPEYQSAVALRIVALDALDEVGPCPTWLPELRDPMARDEAVEVARAAGATRHFHLTVAPLREGAVVSLEEVAMLDGRTLYHQGVHLRAEVEAATTLRRLVRAVAERRPFDGARRDSAASTYESAAAPAPSQPSGEFFFGLGVVGGFAADEEGALAEGAGLAFTFAYERPRFAVGVTTSFFSGNAWLGEGTVFAEYYFLDTDISPYVGGGLGVSHLEISELEMGRGLHGVAAAGVSVLRLNGARVKLSAEVLLPTYEVQAEDGYLDGGLWTPRERSRWVLVPRFLLSVLF